VTGLVLGEVRNGVAVVTLNRPDRGNSWTGRMEVEYRARLAEAEADGSVRVIVITGAGRQFCVGADVAALDGMTGGGGYDDGVREPLARPGRSDDPDLGGRHAFLWAIPKPVIAAVNGAAAGAGMNLALGCDIRLASTAAKFTQAFVKRGLHPDWGGTYFLPRLVGMAKACELIFTGEIIDAQEALRLGIVNAVYQPEELLPATYELARKIAAGPPVAIRLAKRALYHSEESDLRGALEFETFAQNVCSETEDAREGIKAFVEKRAPQFKGR